MKPALDISFPPADSVRILIVEDDEKDAILIAKTLRADGYSLTFDLAMSQGCLEQQLAEQDYDVVVCDHNLGGWTGYDALNILHATQRDIPFIVVSGALGEDAAVDYIKLGASDFVLKDRLKRLSRAVWRALSDRRQRGINAELQEQRGKLEAQLLHAQKMEAIGRLAAGLTHDFNNIISVIVMHAEVMLGHTDLSATARKQAEEIIAAARTGASLTRQTLTFAGKQPARLKCINIDDLISETRFLLEGLLGENIQLQTRLSASSASIKADPSQIQQVLMNLAINGRDAMQSGGRLNVETRTVTARQPGLYAEAGGIEDVYVLVSVSDTGCGMDASVQSHLFEPFFTTKEKNRGTGLGLSTVFGIVKQSAGKICVESQPGAGSTFRLYFPGVQRSVVELRAQTQPRPIGPKTVLLVEDESSLRGLICAQLKSCGLNVLEARSSEKAIEIARTFEGTIDLLLTDVVMPGMGGPEVAGHVRKTHPKIRILYVTGYVDDLADIRQLPDGAVMQKPFSPTELVEKIEELLTPAPAKPASSSDVA